MKKELQAMNMNIGIMLNRLLILLIAIAVVGCSETKTSDPIESYKYWAFENPSEEVKVLRGQFWSSAHFTREYIVYLKIKPTDEWWIAYVDSNDLVVDSLEWTSSSGTPDWFAPSKNTISYSPSNEFYNSRYFRDTLTGECYIYEIQL